MINELRTSYKDVYFQETYHLDNSEEAYQLVLFLARTGSYKILTGTTDLSLVCGCGRMAAAIQPAQ